MATKLWISLLTLLQLVLHSGCFMVRQYKAIDRLFATEYDADLSNDGPGELDFLRRIFLGSALISGVPNLIPASAEAFEKQILTVPLEWNGDSFLIYYRVDGALFRAVLDTGSPFLMIPGSCGANTKSKSGCYRQQGKPSGLPDTYEQFDGFEGNVEWRTAPVTFVNATGSLTVPSVGIVFGVASESLLSGRGGVFFGLVRDVDAWIRPSFLSQTPVRSFRIRLTESNPNLTLSTESLIREKSLSMNSDLRRKYGSPTDHYSVVATSLEANGHLVGDDHKPIYVIFDTGVTGMVVSRDLFDERYTLARQKRERNLWGNVTIRFADGSSVSARSPLTTPFDPRQTWKKFRGHLVVIGLSFLLGKVLTVDIDRRELILKDI